MHLVQGYLWKQDQYIFFIWKVLSVLIGLSKSVAYICIHRCFICHSTTQMFRKRYNSYACLMQVSWFLLCNNMHSCIMHNKTKMWFKKENWVPIDFSQKVKQTLVMITFAICIFQQFQQYEVNIHLNCGQYPSLKRCIQYMLLIHR